MRAVLGFLRECFLVIAGGVRQEDFFEAVDDARKARLAYAKWKEYAEQRDGNIELLRKMLYGSVEPPGHRPIKGFEPSGRPIFADRQES